VTVEEGRGPQAAPAAEESIDEVPPAPVSEERPGVGSGSTGHHQAAPVWWSDADPVVPPPADPTADEAT